MKSTFGSNSPPVCCQCSDASPCFGLESAHATSRRAFLIKVSGIGQPVNWLLSAVGRIYLAFCSHKEREEILQKLAKSEKPEDRLARDAKRLHKILGETRQSGYGIRDPGFRRGAHGNP